MTLRCGLSQKCSYPSIDSKFVVDFGVKVTNAKITYEFCHVVSIVVSHEEMKMDLKTTNIATEKYVEYVDMSKSPKLQPYI
jgi:hypothetical protein